MGGGVGGAFAGPDEVEVVGCEDGEAVEAWGEGDAAAAVGVESVEVEFVVVVSVEAGGVDDEVVVVVPEGAPVDGVVAGVLFFVFDAEDVAARVVDECGAIDLQFVVAFAVGAVEDA